MIESQQETKAFIADKDRKIALAASNINLIYVLADIQERIITDVVSLLEPYGVYKFEIKRDINKIQRITRDLVEEVMKVCSDDDALAFGVDADEAYDNFMVFVKEYIHPEEQHSIAV